MTASDTVRIRRQQWAILGVAAFIVLLSLVIGSAYYQLVLTQVLLWAVLSLAWNLLSGYSGMFSFGHAAFWGLGAYTVALGLLYAGERLRTSDRARREPMPAGEPPDAGGDAPGTHHEQVGALGDEPSASPRAPGTDATTVLPDGDTVPSRPPSTPAAVDRADAQRRPRYPPAPGEQMSLEDPPPAQK